MNPVPPEADRIKGRRKIQEESKVSRHHTSKEAGKTLREPGQRDLLEHGAGA